MLHGLYLDSPFTLTEGRLLFEIARHGRGGGVRPAPRARHRRRLPEPGAEPVRGRVPGTRHRSAADARRQEIRITDAGRAAAADLDRRSAGQIAELLRGADCDRLLNAMQVITSELGGRKQTPPMRLRGDRAATTASAVGDAAPAGGAATWAGCCTGTRPSTRPSSAGTPPSRQSARASSPSTRPCATPTRTAPTGWIAEVDGVAGRLGLLRPRQRDHGPAPPAASRAVGARPRPRRDTRRAVPAVRPRGRLRRHHPVDLRPPGGGPQGLPGRRVHLDQRVLRQRLRPPDDEPDLVPPPLTSPRLDSPNPPPQGLTRTSTPGSEVTTLREPRLPLTTIEVTSAGKPLSLVPLAERNLSAPDDNMRPRHARSR